jgi:hypothetical protein
VQVAIVSLVVFCTNLVQPSKQGFELVKILKSLNIGRFSGRLRFWLASGFLRSGASRRSIFDVCTGGCIIDRLVIRLSGILCHNRRSQCHSGRTESPTEHLAQSACQRIIISDASAFRLIIQKYDVLRTWRCSVSFHLDSILVVFWNF